MRQHNLPILREHFPELLIWSGNSGQPVPPTGLLVSANIPAHSGESHGKHPKLGYAIYGQYTAWPSCSLPWNDPPQRISEYIGTHKRTNRGNVLAWVATPNRPLLKWGARGNVFSKASPTWYDIQNNVKKNSKMF